MSSMNVQEAIKNADPGDIDRFLWWARLHPMDPDKANMTEMIIELGMTPYRAAAERAGSGATSRSFKTLYYHARVIADNLLDHLGHGVSGLVGELSRNEEVFCSPDQIARLREAAEDMGLVIEEDIRVRVVRRR